METGARNGMVYFAVCAATGEVWESTDFREVYNAVMASFRASVHYCKYYEYLSAVIAYGAVIEKGEVYGVRCMHYAFRDICRITVSGVCGKIIMREVEKMGV